MSRAKKEFGSRESVVFVVKKQVPPTFNRTHWLLPCFVIMFGLLRGFKLTVDITFVVHVFFRFMMKICLRFRFETDLFSDSFLFWIVLRKAKWKTINYTYNTRNFVVASIDAPYHTVAELNWFLFSQSGSVRIFLLFFFFRWQIVKKVNCFWDTIGTFGQSIRRELLLVIWHRCHLTLLK